MPAGVPPAFRPGDLIGGRFHVVRYISRGAMGEVYEVEDGTLGGRVALKTVRREIAAEPKSVERFKREIHLARRVTHPNICRIFDVGFHKLSPADPADPGAEVPFLTMELLSGETLSARVARRPLLPKEALPLIEQVAAGLDAAHGAGIIHRDFKSGNVIIASAADGTERAVITDFGLARAVGPETGLLSISETGAVVGTPAYMAPEQVQGLELTPAADIYSLGIVLYEMVTGRRPFTGDSAINVAVKRLSEPPPPPRNHVPDLDAVWQVVILKCLERDPGERFESAGAVAQALVSGSALPPRGRLRTTAARALLGKRLAGLLGAIAVGAAWLLLARGPSETGSRTGTARAPVATRRSLAVLPFARVSGPAESEWLSTALAEALTTEMASGDALRLVPGPEVARAVLELGIPSERGPSTRDLAGLRRDLGSDYVITGSYNVSPSDAAGLVRIDARLLDAATGEIVAPSSATGTPIQVFDLVSRLAAPLRTRLGLPAASASEALALEASLPKVPEAARLYAEGLAALRAGNPQAARAVLERGARAEPEQPLLQAALAECWSALGYEAEASEAGARALRLASNLPESVRLRVEARAHESRREWERAADAYRQVLGAHPDDLESGLRLAEAETSAGRAREALATLDRLRRLTAPDLEDPRLDLAAARAHQELGDPAEALSRARRAATRAEARGARVLAARARLLQASALRALGSPAEARAAADEARSLFEATGDRAGQARALEQLALVVDASGDLDGARRLHERALLTYREIGDRSSEARVLTNIGASLLDEGRIEQAQRYYDQSLLLFREVGAKYQMGIVLNDVGARLQQRGELRPAKKRYQEALALFGETGERTGVAAALTNLGEVAYLEGDLAKAQPLHEEALAINRERSDKGGSAYDLFRLGEVALARGDLQVAKDRYDEALALQSETKDAVGAARTRLGLAARGLALPAVEEAMALARTAEEVARNEGVADLEALAHAVLASGWLAQGEVEQARAEGGKAVAAGRRTEVAHARLLAEVAAARATAASGVAAEVGTALAALETVLARATRLGFVPVRLETLLARAEVRLRAGQTTEARRELSALSRDAEAKGFGLVARRAAALAAAAGT
jgi:tetratricopeptide (TPR) repeat protein